MGGRLQLGAVVAERYELLDILGEGSTGVVFRANDLDVRNDHGVVALKVIHSHLHADRQILGRFRREAKILRRLKGEHLCKLLEWHEEDGLLMLALEYVAGPSLEEYLKKHSPLPLQEASIITAQICKALEAAHAVGVIHRDLKPSNVLIELSKNGSPDAEPPSFRQGLAVRVVDFGLAKMIHGETTGTLLTEHDMIFGTPAYMSPEQVRGDELDARCDVYAVAIMFYEMIVGEVPFDSKGGPLATMTAHLNEPVKPPSSMAPEQNIPSDIDRTVMCALSKERLDRFDSVEKFADALLHGDAVLATVRDPGGILPSGVPPEALRTTMKSRDGAELIAGAKGGAKVKIVVSDAPSSSQKILRESQHPASSFQESGQEKRLWLALAVLAGLIAVAAGVLFGVR